jgi:hypothetical protein
MNSNYKKYFLSRGISVIVVCFFLFSPYSLYSLEPSYSWELQTEGLSADSNISSMTCFSSAYQHYAILGTKENKDSIWFSSLTKEKQLSWQSVSKGIEDKDILTLYYWALNKTIYAGTQWNAIYTISTEALTKDLATTSWRYDYSGIPIDSTINCFFGTEKFLYAGSSGSLYRLENGKTKWTALSLKEGTKDLMVDILDVQTVDNKTFLLATTQGVYQGTLAKPTDLELNCAKVGDYSQKVNTILKNTDGTVLIGTSIGLMQLKEGKWQRPSTGLPEKPLLKIQSDLKDSNILNLVYRDQFIRVERASLSPIRETIDSSKLSKRLTCFASATTLGEQPELLLGDDVGTVFRLITKPEEPKDHTFEFKLAKFPTLTAQKQIDISGTLLVDYIPANKGDYFVSCNQKDKFPVTGGNFQITDISLEKEGMNECALQIYDKEKNLISIEPNTTLNNIFSVYLDSKAPVVTIKSIQYRYKKIDKEWKNTDLITNPINMDDKALIIYGTIQDDSISDFSENDFIILSINEKPIKLTFLKGKSTVAEEYQSGLTATFDKIERNIVIFTLDNSKLKRPIIELTKSPSMILITIQAQDQAGNTSEAPKLPPIYFSANIYLKLTIGKNEVMEQRPENQLKLPLYGWTLFSYSLDVPPIIINGRTMVPLRFIAEAFGAKVGWDAPIKEITIELKNLFITLYINDKIAYITDSNNPNARSIVLDPPPILYHGRTLIPIRAIAEIFGANVDWNKDKPNDIIIIYPAPDTSTP